MRPSIANHFSSLRSIGQRMAAEPRSVPTACSAARVVATLEDPKSWRQIKRKPWVPLPNYLELFCDLCGPQNRSGKFVQRLYLLRRAVGLAIPPGRKDEASDLGKCFADPRSPGVWQPWAYAITR
jgi:hypothetical protein